MWQSIPIGPGLTVVGSSNVLRSTLTVEGLQEQLEGIAADEAESTAEAAKFLTKLRQWFRLMTITKTWCLWGK